MAGGKKKKSISTLNPNVLCPFYRFEDFRNAGITCEGFLEDTTVRTKFGDPAKLREFQRKYCCTFAYIMCPLFKTIYKKYCEN